MKRSLSISICIAVILVPVIAEFSIAVDSSKTGIPMREIDLAGDCEG